MIVGLFLLILAQQDSISVHSARPLADAAQQLETKYGVPVFYEDPAWTPAQFPNPGGRPPVFRTYDFAFGFDASQPIVAVLQKMLVQASAEGIPGNFKIVPIGDGYGLVPVEGSALDLPISFPTAERTVQATFQLIFNALTAASVHKVVGPSAIAVNLFIQAVATVGANHERARDVMVRLLSDMRRPDLWDRHAGVPKMSWSMFYDPNYMQWYVVNVRAVLLGKEIVPQSAEYARLIQAKDKWVSHQIIRYEFIYTSICGLCLAPTSPPGWEPIRFRVGLIPPAVRVGVLTGVWADRPEARERLDKYSTVEKQFDYIEEQLEKHPQRVVIEYDPDDGHPTNVRFGNGMTTDGDYGFTITDFTPLPLNRSRVTPAGLPVTPAGTLPK